MSDTALVVLYIFSTIVTFNTGYLHGVYIVSEDLPKQNLRLLKKNKELKEELRKIKGDKK